MTAPNTAGVLTDTDDPQALQELLVHLQEDPVLAHEYLFQHRHPDATPTFHTQMILDWHGDAQYVLTEAFRGAAKSTVAEEAIATLALNGAFYNGIILGENETRAVERLNAVKNELENNEKIQAIYGPQMGNIWGEKRIELLNGTYLQALGRDQSMRGVKHKDRRPDMLFVDDYEDEESVATPEARAKVWRRFFSVVIPAMEPRNFKVRVAGTPLDPEAYIVRLRKLRNWLRRRYPIEYIDKHGVRRAMWESRFPIEWIDNRRQEMYDAGESQTWEREYMLNPVDEKTKPFIASDLRVEHVTRTWEPTYAIYDPARTTKELTSAHTGKIVASWLRNRLVVWESSGSFWKPDETINDMFDVNQRYQPVAIGVEVDGLEQYLMQPIRKAQVDRRTILPIRELRAPRNKMDFIKGLQPFVKAHEVIIVGDQPWLVQQFDAFPRGRIDILNALAFMQRIRSGVPVYRTFALGNVEIAEPRLIAQSPCYLCVNAGEGFTTGVLTQITDDGIIVLADWLYDGAPGEAIGNMLRNVSVEFAPSPQYLPKLVAPPEHWREFNRLGLVHAARSAGASIYEGGDIAQGREELRAQINKPQGGLKVNMRASWALRGFADGFAYPVEKTGALSDEPQDNLYAKMIEAIEALAARSRMFDNRGDSAARVEYTADGRKFISARATPRR